MKKETEDSSSLISEDEALTNEENWQINAEEQIPEQVRSLGRYLYISMFYDRSPAVTNELYRKHDEAKLSGEEWMSEQEPLQWPAEAFVEQFAVQSGINLPMLRRFCDIASREIAQQIALSLQEKRSAILTPHWSDRLHESRIDRRRESLDSDIALMRQVSETGLSSTISDHSSMLRVADYYSINLSLQGE